MQTITITDDAANRIRTLTEGTSLGLRVKVVGGGCSGLSYKIETDAPGPRDKVFTHPSGAFVIIDPKSFLYLMGMQVDFVETVMTSGFHLTNPNVTRTCGCGSSFSI